MIALPKKSELKNLFKPTKDKLGIVWRTTRNSNQLVDNRLQSVYVTLDSKKYLTARLVYAYYNGDPRNSELVHLDGNFNNISLDNLVLASEIERVPKTMSTEYLNRVFKYSKKTGKLLWKSQPVFGRKSVVIGKQVGYPDKRGYLNIRLCGGLHRIHRLIWLMVYGEWPKYVIDHINGVKVDNRLSNLRDVPQKYNLQNMHDVTSKTGYIGVHASSGGRFYATISVNSKTTYVGTFNTPEEADRARWKMKRKVHKGAIG